MFGTMAGYVIVYDLRYNVVSSYYRHGSKAPINSIAAFAPARAAIPGLQKVDAASPMALVATGS
jgi:hypothetical protein